jgi:DNA-binding FadR family transcriptional regulator
MERKKVMAKFVSLQRKRLYEEVSDALKEAIFKGEYQVGGKLPSEMELAEAFDVSRSVVREAIRYLELTGLVTIRQGATGGAFVSEMSNNILQIYMRDMVAFGKISVNQYIEIRRHIEPEVSRLAALRATDKDLEYLEKSVLLSKNGKPGDAFLINNMGFHQLLGRASQNPFYMVIEDCLVELSIEFIKTIKPVDVDPHDYKEHDAIFRAVFERDPEEAMAATRIHIESVSEQVLGYEQNYKGMIKKEKGDFD